MLKYFKFDNLTLFFYLALIWLIFYFLDDYNKIDLAWMIFFLILHCIQVRVNFKQT